METVNYINGYNFETISDDSMKVIAKDKRTKIVQFIGNNGMDTTNETSLAVYPHIAKNDVIACNCLECNPRSLFEVSRDIRRNWKNVWFGAVPYLSAMSSLSSVQDDYGLDSGTSVVLYFLSNATTWKGVHAKRIKAELNYYLKK